MKEIFVLILIGTVLIVAQNELSSEQCRISIGNCVGGTIIVTQNPETRRCGCLECDKEHYLVIKSYPFPEEDNTNIVVPLQGTKCVKFCNNSEYSEVNFNQAILGWTWICH